MALRSFTLAPHQSEEGVWTIHAPNPSYPKRGRGLRRGEVRREVVRGQAEREGGEAHQRVQEREGLSRVELHMLPQARRLRRHQWLAVSTACRGRAEGLSGEGSGEGERRG